MKHLIGILLIFFLASCENQVVTVDTSKPDDIPEWVRWGTYEHYAYEEDRIRFNEDSTIMLISPDHIQDRDYNKIDFTNGNVQIKE
jgi:hypothetical protein